MKLPKINRIIIENFSLYKLQRRIDINVPDGVMCLAGANGLGKSTFISIVSYAMTGVVVQPDIDFKSLNSISEFAKKASGFADHFFEGRICERDRMQAQVSVEFVLGDYHYYITREFFSNSDLLRFSRISDEKGETVDSFQPLLIQYNNFFVKDSGLSSFEQFIFLQTYVLTFDESKKLLFWDENVMNRVMYLFFSLDADSAQRADTLRKNIKRYESNMRNIQWDISKAEKRLGKILSDGAVTEQEMNEIEAACNEIEAIQKEIDEKQSKYSVLIAKHDEVKLLIDDNTLKQNEVKTQYEQVFSSLYSSDGFSVESDEKIQYSLKQIILSLTDNESADISELLDDLKRTIIDVIKHKRVENEKAKLDQLRKLDERLVTLKMKEDEYKKTLERIAAEMTVCEMEKEQLTARIVKYAKENDAILRKKDCILQGRQSQREAEALKINLEQLRQEKTEAENNRNRCLEELRPLDEQMKLRFASVAESYIPTFQKYARSFIGLDIDVELMSVNGIASLVVNVNGSDRRSRYQLSESQQYFLDIALRFSLIEYIQSNHAFMLIDTPEGSLDIAYESRAGKMFAEFVSKGYSVIMTANINTSQILLKMAELCGHDLMRVERMTDWTTLTEVQQEEQSVIEEAYNSIEERLAKRHA